MNSDGNVRLSVPIPVPLDDQLKRMLGWGQKAEAVRALLELLLRAWIENKYIVSDLLNGNCKIVVQSLNEEALRKPPTCERCDE
jgi:hypothetical protein